MMPTRILVPLLTILLALLVASCGSSSVDVTALRDAVEDEESQPTPEPTATSVPTATVAPTATAVPTATSTPEATATPEPTSTTAPVVDSVFADEFASCVIESNALDGDTVLLLAEFEEGTASAIAGAATPEQTDQIAKAAAQCGFADEFAFNIDLPVDVAADVATCVGDRLDAEGGGALFFGISSFVASEQIPEAAKAGFIDGMTTCVDADAFGDVIFEELIADPQLGSMMDIDCMADLLQTSDFVPEMWRQAADDPAGFSFEEYGYQFGAGPALRCVSMGGMIALAAAEEGVEIGDETIACIDAELEASNFAERLANGEVTEEGASVVMLECMSAEELEAFVGG